MGYPASLSKLIVLARIARSRIEVLAKEEGGPPTLAGYCGIASRYIERAANKDGVYPLYVVGRFRVYNRIMGMYQWKSGHAWLEHSGYVIDITATQFKNSVSRIERNFDKRVYICRTSNPHYEKCFIGVRAKIEAQVWYIEKIDEICDKADNLIDNQTHARM